MAQGWVYEDDTVGWRTIVAGDLPTSGVTAATYGDGSHVGQFTVDAQGVITAASSVAITSSGGITTLASPGSTITVTNPTGPTADVDLPASGVTAGSYGTSTNVPHITVDAEGRLTAASNVAIGGLPGSGLVQLFSTTLVGTAALDTGANAIAAGHGSLYVVVMCRDANAGVRSTSYSLRLNGDSGANYDIEYQYFGNTGSSGQSLGQTAWTAAGLLISAGGTANYASTVIIEFPMYDNTTFNKTGFMRMMMPDTNGSRTAVMGLGYRSTSAINQITLDTTAHFIAGSTMTVYGTA